MEITFTGTYRQEDIFHACQMLGHPTGVQKWLRIGGLALIIVFWIGYILKLLSMGGETSNSRLEVISVSIGVAIAAYVLALPYLNSSTAAKQLWNQPIIRKPQNGHVDSQGVFFTDRSDRTPIIWDRISHKRRSDRMTVLRTDDGTAVILPRSFFKTEEEWRRFNRLVDECVREAE